MPTSDSDVFEDARPTRRHCLQDVGASAVVHVSAVGGPPTAGAHSRAGAGLYVAHHRCYGAVLFVHDEIVC